MAQFVNEPILMKDIMAVLPWNRKFKSAKISDHEDFRQKSHSYYENLKQNVWNEFLPVLAFSRLKDAQNLFKVLSKL